MFSAIVTGLRVTNWVNWIVAALLMVFFALLLANPEGFRDTIFSGFDAQTGARTEIRHYLYGVLALVPPLALAVHFILTRLASLVRDTSAGAAFTERNARRLSTIGWALLAINVADLFYGWLSVRASEATGEYFGWSLSLTGWIAVPMLFVLAHVFREGTAMREDLEGTV
ncbi:DUF2975 domain-containing protein [Erythrobacter aureus]|uniref:DUF2975 domain-containing protein n=1 Tax=Erythrobacter aureus TaxID=2182384 RepID=UPI003A955A7A